MRNGARLQAVLSRCMLLSSGLVVVVVGGGVGVGVGVDAVVDAVVVVVVVVVEWRHQGRTGVLMLPAL